LFFQIVESKLTCPICNKRKAKRLCPARAENICTICCGEQREVTIDCPSDCTHLKASREYDYSRLVVDPETLPFAESKFGRDFARSKGPLLAAIDFAIITFAAEHRALVDSDVLAALRTLAETYQTRTSGIIYEKPIDYALQRDLYDALKNAIAEFRSKLEREAGLGTLRDSEVRDSLIFLTQLCAVYQNGRPKGRAYIDLIRAQFPGEELQKAAPSIVLP
jgi:hypothetical protein